MRHAVIVAHPNPASFTGSLASAYREEGAARGQEVMVRDLYGMRFDPCLQESEMPWSKHFALRGDVIAERELLKDVDVFALFYPLWLNLPPAILKGYLERVFVMDSAHHPGGADNASPSKPRKLISVTSSGAPTDWVIRTGALQTMREQFDGSTVQPDQRAWPSLQYAFRSLHADGE